MLKSEIYPEQMEDLNAVGRSYYCFLLESALTSIRQARMLVSGDSVEQNHELPEIEQLIAEALDAS